MLCRGEWFLDDDGLVRPIIRARILDGDGNWRRIRFIVDTGADKTVICADEFQRLRLEYARPADRIGGVGGLVDSVDVKTEIQLERDDGQWVTLRGTYTACPEPNVLDTSLLGRDVLNNFAVIVDRPANRIFLLHEPHGYTIQRQQ